MAAPQIISLGLGSPASIGWFLTFGLGEFGSAEGVTEAPTAGNPTGGLLPVTFQAGVVTFVPSPFLQEIKGGLHDIRPIEETP